MRSASRPAPDGPPFVLDETIDGIGILLRALGIAPWTSSISRSPSSAGSRGRAQMRDLCVSLGIAMTIEDTWGGDMTTAAIAHLARSTPAEFLFSATDFNSYVTSRAEGAPQRKAGRMTAPDRPGLGSRRARSFSAGRRWRWANPLYS